MSIERSVGQFVQGTLVGGGYKGLTKELDEVVTHAAQLLAEEFRRDVVIRFNTNRRGGGAFLKGLPPGKFDSYYVKLGAYLRSHDNSIQVQAGVYEPIAFSDRVDWPETMLEERACYKQFADLPAALDWLRDVVDRAAITRILGG